MTTAKVLDSYSVIAFFENEKGSDKVAELLRQARDKSRPLLLSAVNWGEVYYIALRTAGRDTAEKILLAIDTLPIEVIPTGREITKIAAEFKAFKKMSYADCFAAALAKVRKAQVVTGDKEFKEVEDVISIFWI